MWATVDGYDGRKTVIVGAVGPNSYARENGVAALDAIRSLVPDSQVAKGRVSAVARATAEASEVAVWLAHCRFAAGIELTAPTGPLPAGRKVPPIPNENASAAVADRNGSAWWVAAKAGEQAGLPGADWEPIREVGRAWYRLRDSAIRAQQLASVSSAATDEQLARAIADLNAGRDLGDKPGYFLGQFMADWLRHVEQLSKSGDLGKALEITYALIIVAEREAASSGREPAPAYTERAAMIHRKRKEYREEVAVLERWERACPPERRGPGATQEKLAKRLVKARELHAKAISMS